MSRIAVAWRWLGITVSLPLLFSAVQAEPPYGGAVKFHVLKAERPVTVRLYRLLLADGTHCYTTSEREVSTLSKSSKYQAKIEPMDAFVYAEQAPGTTRLYRITQRLPGGEGWRSFYTASEAEMKSVRKHKHCELHSMKAHVFTKDFRYGNLTFQKGQTDKGNVQDVTIAVDQASSEHNLGIEHCLDIGQDGGVALLRFDLSCIPEDATVESATLELFSFRVGSSEEESQRSWPINVYEFKYPWKEGTGYKIVTRRDGATLTTSDGKTKWATGHVAGCTGELLGTVVHEVNQPRLYRWKLNTTVVEEWVSGERPNYGMLVGGKPPGKYVTFGSSNTTTVKNRPTLRLAVAPPNFKGVLGDIVPIYNCYNPATAEYFLATSEKERDSFIEKAKQDVASNPNREDERRKLREQERLANKPKPPAVSTPAKSIQSIQKEVFPDKMWYNNLEIGKTYRLSKETPLMSKWNPQGFNEMARVMAEHKVIPLGGLIKVSDIKQRSGTPWYRVKALNAQKRPIADGWVSGMALIGQDIQAK